MADFSPAIVTVPTSTPIHVGLSPSPAGASNPRLPAAVAPFRSVLQHKLNARSQTNEQAPETAAAPEARRWREQNTTRATKPAPQEQLARTAEWPLQAGAGEPQQERPEKENAAPCAAVATGIATPCEPLAVKPLSFSFSTSLAAAPLPSEETLNDAGATLADDGTVASDSESPVLDGSSAGFAGLALNLNGLVEGFSRPTEFGAFRMAAKPPAAEVPQTLSHSESSQAQPASLGADPHVESGCLVGRIEDSSLLENTPVVIQGNLQKTAADALTDRQSALQPKAVMLRSTPGHILGDLPADSRLAQVEFTFSREQPRTSDVTLQASGEQIQTQFPPSGTRQSGPPTALSALCTSNPEDSAGGKQPGLTAANEKTQPGESARVSAENQPSFSTGDRKPWESNAGLSLRERPEPDGGPQPAAQPQRSTSNPTPGSPLPAGSQVLHQDPPPARGSADSAQTRPLTPEPDRKPEPPGPRPPLRQLTVRLESGADRRLDVQFTEAGGSVNVKIRTQSDLMASALRSEVSQLESDLNSRGWRADLSASRSISEALPGREDPPRQAESLRTGTVRGNAFQGSAGQPPTNSEHGFDSPKRQRDWSSDEQELSDMTALRRLAVKGGRK